MTSRDHPFKNLEPCVDTGPGGWVEGRKRKNFEGLAENHSAASFRVHVWLRAAGQSEVEGIWRGRDWDTGLKGWKERSS